MPDARRVLRLLNRIRSGASELHGALEDTKKDNWVGTPIENFASAAQVSGTESIAEKAASWIATVEGRLAAVDIGDLT